MEVNLGSDPVDCESIMHSSVPLFAHSLSLRIFTLISLFVEEIPMGKGQHLKEFSTIVALSLPFHEH